MVQVIFGDRRVDIPSSPDELDTRQYVRALAISVALGAGTLSPLQARRRLMSLFLGLNVDFGLLQERHARDIDGALDALDGFFHTAPGGAVSMPLDTVRNLLPETGGFRGPGDWLEGVSFGEFIECLSVLDTLSDSGVDGEAVAGAYSHVARVLYHIPLGTPVPEILLVHAPRLFMAVWRRICSEPVDINGRDIDFRIIFRPSGDARPDDRTGWTGITFEVAAAGLFGDTRGVEATDFWSVLLYLYKCKFEYINDKN